MTSLSSSPPAPVPAAQFPDPALLTSEERLIRIETYRKRKQAGENLTVEELRHAISLISADRAAASRERKKSQKDAAGASKPIPKLEDL